MPIVGRDAELKTMLHAAELAARGDAQIVILGGPTGIGKSALSRAFCQDLTDFRVLSVAGVPSEQDIKYSAANRVIQSAHDELSLDLRRANLIQEDSTMMAAGGALISVLDDIRDGSPVALIVEDAHLVDDYSLKAIGFMLLRMMSDEIITVLDTEHINKTKKDVGLAGNDERVTQIDLAGLTVPALREYLASEKLPALSVSQLAQIAKWSNGNPLYVKALVGAMEGGRGIPEPLSLADVPPSLTAAVKEWSDSFPQRSRPILDVLAVLNAPTTVPTLQQLVHSDTLLDDIEPLVTEGAAQWRTEADDPRLELMHSGQRDAVYASIPQSRRRELHRAAADILAPPAKWRHQIAALEEYDGDLASELLEAADRESAHGDLSHAAQYELAASEAAPESDIRRTALLKAVRLLVISGQYAAALGYGARIEDTIASPQKNEALGFLEYARGHDAGASEYLRLAREGFGDADGAARASAELASLQRSLGLGAQAVRSAQYALARTADAGIIGQAQANIAWGAALQDGPAEGLRRLSQLRVNPAEVPAPDMDALACRGILRGLSGQLTDALADLRVVVRRSTPGLTRRSDYAAKVNAAACHLMLGEWEQARRTASLAFDEAQISGRDVDFAVVHSMSAAIYALQGQWEWAEADLREAQSIANETDFAAPEFHIRQAAGTIGFARQDWRTVIRELGRAMEDSSNEGRVRVYGTWFLPMLGVACARAHELSKGAEALAALEALEPTGAMPIVASKWVKGNLLYAQGDLPAASRAFRDGLAVPPDGGEPVLHRSMLRCDFGRVLIETDAKDEARSQLLAAEKVFRSLGAQPLVAQCHELLGRSEASDHATGAESFWGELTDREKDTAKLVGRGWTNKEIAQELYVSTKTVEYHLGNMYAKGNLKNRRQLRDVIQTLAA
ncbi:LuxR family transcriptional regulator [Streptomyces sp. ADI96-02]|uniref:helix-turn-helix transcriptional regulator n=1 Tax=Streptomyces sp. ADI96-02 TaxID=1522760 RepID=UPI0013DE68A5|nr:LuxR family transcriptional regulator [Streptomyces sp. ADI96-02]